MRQWRQSTGLGRVALVSGLLGAALVPLAVTAPPVAAAVPPAPNPPIEQSCGLGLTLVLDASGSVQQSQAVDDVRDAGDALLTALTNTNSTARVTQFASLSEVLAPRTLIDDASMQNGGVLAEALQDYYSPIPPRPPNVNIYSYRGNGNPQSSNNFSSANSSNQYTNWDQGLRQAGTGQAELMVFVTDGDPTGYDFDKPGDPFEAGPPSDVAVNTNRGEANQLTLDRAVQEANTIKNGATRMLAVGVGSALSNSGSRDRLIQISGPQVVRDADLADVEDLNDIDVALVTDFEDLAAFMRSIVLQLCSPSLTVRKLAQTPGDASYTPEEGRDITVTPTVPGGDGFTWILPDTAPASSKTEPTDDNGFAQFQWEPDPPEEDSAATVSEATDPEMTPGRPDQDDYTCNLRDEFGNVRTISDDFADPANPSFELDPIGQEIVTCTLYNSFDYEPDIALAKVNSPTEVRGDLNPPAQVTSDYVATNPGNTPLDNVAISDDRCGPVTPVLAGGDNVGDDNGDGRLDPGEAWEYTCTQPVLSSRTTTAGGRNFVNNAEVSGTDPTGELVTATASDDVDVFTPHITLAKTANGVEVATVSEDDPVTYEYVVTNAGNTPLGTVTLTDDPPCTPTTLVDDGNGDTVLDVGEAWTYECVTTAVDDVVNTASVTAVPLNPLDGNAPFTAPNPPVTDQDPAQVVVVSAEIDLTKSVTPDDVLLDPGANPPAEPVTYRFVADNNGSTPLGRPGTASPTAPGWIGDGQCDEAAEYVSGDSDADDLFDTDETWTFSCPGSVLAPTVNVATLTGQPTDAGGAPLPGIPTVSAVAAAFVDVHQPVMTVTKTALEPVVLDPDATPVDGPDTPTPRPAVYRYEVANAGDVPLDLSGSPPTDDKCAPLVYEEGDTADPALLDPGEVWVYSCTTTLEREDANDPPGDQTAQVDNTVQVAGVPQLDGDPVPDKTVEAQASASVDVIQPGLALTKTVSDDVVKFDTIVTYTVTVENTGDTALDLVGPVDDKCAPLAYVAGDVNEDGRLDGANTTAETWTFTCPRAIAPEGSDVDTNTASVTGVDPLGNSYVDEDSVDVRVVRPAIEVTKVPSETLVPSGTEITYDFEVRNVGLSQEPTEDALEDVLLVDGAVPALPLCRNPVLIAKEGGNQDDILEREPPEVWRYQCASPVVAPTTNVAVVGALGGQPVGLSFQVADWAAAFVQPFNPGIDVVKTASPVRLTGSGRVTYRYEVTNTGDVPLAGVAEGIEDDTCSPVRYVSGDKDDDGLLDTEDSIFEDAVDETWIFECSTVVDETTTNVVLVPGIPSGPDGGPLCGPDTGEGLVKVPCDVSARDSAVATVDPALGPGTGGIDPGAGNGDGPGTGGLGDTGAAPWLRELLLLGLLLSAVGGGLLVAGRRREPALE